MTNRNLAETWRVESIEIQRVKDVVMGYVCAQYMFAVVQTGPRAFATVWGFN